MYPSVSRALAVCAVLFLAQHFISCDIQPKKPAPSGFSDNSFTRKLKLALKPFDTAGKKVFRSIGDDVRFIYQSDDYQPIWVKQNYKPVHASERIIEELEDTYWDGLDTARYQLARLKDLRIKLDTTKVNSVHDAIAFDTLLTRNYLMAARELLIGKISPKKVDSLWYYPNDSAWNAPQLLISGKKDYPSLSTYRSEVPTYKLLREEYQRFKNLASDSAFLQAIEGIRYVKHPDSDMLYNIFDVIGYEMPWLETIPGDSISELKQIYFAYQAYRGIPQTGRLDSITLAYLATPVDTFLQKISINMERVRWMQRQFTDLYVIVNVSLMEMFLRRGDTNAMHMRVVVGKPERQTPSLSASMANVVINPPWGVPPTILKKDVLPGLQKNGKKYLDKKGLRVYDQEGKRVQASAITAKNYRRYNYKQAPGDDNALGYVKFNLPNKWDIYLHDTPHREDFVKRFRALSSGCIRLQRPLDLAVYVLSDLEGKRYTPGRLDTVIKTHKTRWEVLKNKIPVHITYLTAFEDTTGKHIQFPRDIYHRDDKLMTLLN
ncbi:MAG: hypothetical protein K0Q79_3259 [Flavipsychrobacter sp.]|jgi:murein L,D-transpeptidase YcbB/YkuD|nr:hypothetical protein [Flavipsychrobacter sp.]